MWEWPDTRGGLWEWPDKGDCLWWEWPDTRGGLWGSGLIRGLWYILFRYICDMI